MSSACQPGSTTVVAVCPRGRSQALSTLLPGASASRSKTGVSCAPPDHVGRHHGEGRDSIAGRRMVPLRSGSSGVRHDADSFDRRGFDDQPLARHDEAVMPMVRVLEARRHFGRRWADIDGVRGIAALVADVDAADELDPRVGNVLLPELRLGLAGEIVEERRKLRHQGVVERRLDGLLPQRPDVGETHPVGREDAGEGVDQHRRHAERVGHQAGVLAAGAAEAIQGVAGHVVAALHGDLLDRVGHVLDRDPEIAGRDLDRGARVARRRADLRRQRREFLAHRVGIERLVLAGAEDVGEKIRLQLAQHDVAVGDAEWPAAPVAGRAGIGARRLGPHAIAGAVEDADRAAARRHGVDQHHRRTHAHTGHQRLEGALVVAVVVRHVGGGAAHVEGDDLAEAGLAGGFHRADDAAGRAAENGVLALEERGVGEPAARLHEHEPRAAELRRHPIDIAAQQGREVGVHDRGVAAADELHQRAGLVAGRYLGEADLPRERRRRLLVGGEAVAVHEDDRGTERIPSS